MTQSASAQIAPISRRAIGFLIDAFIATGLAVVLGGGLVVAATLAGPEGMLTTLLIGGLIVVLLLLGWFVVYTLMQAGAGSIGMRAQGLRLVAAREHGPLGFGRALLRNIIFGLACAIVVGYFTPLFDGSGRFQGWHDKVAGSLMVDARAAGVIAPGPPVEPASLPVTGTAQQAAPLTLPTPAAPPSAAQPTVSASAVSAPQARPAAPAGEDSLIAFVPGITQEAWAPRMTPAPALEPDAESDLDATVLGHRAARPELASPPPAPARGSRGRRPRSGGDHCGRPGRHEDQHPGSPARVHLGRRHARLGVTAHDLRPQPGAGGRRGGRARAR